MKLTTSTSSNALILYHDQTIHKCNCTYSIACRNLRLKTSYNVAANFTQLIWKNTKELGVGIAVSLSGNLFVVCNYKPKGNTIEGFQDNVILPYYRPPLPMDGQLSPNASNVESSQTMPTLDWILSSICMTSLVFHRYL